MKERPILFSAPMVRSLLEGRKTQTRRAVKNTGLYAIDAAIHGEETAQRELAALATRSPYGQPGDLLWVKETTIKVEDHGYAGPCYVESEEGRAVLEYGLSPAPDDVTEVDPQDIRKRPAIHMPRTMSRILLEVTAVRVERLQDISEADAEAEGIQEIVDAGVDHDGTPRDAYRALWEQINGAGSWSANPWVWVVEFKRAEVPA